MWTKGKKEGSHLRGKGEKEAIELPLLDKNDVSFFHPTISLANV